MIKNGTISPETMMAMTSSERRAFFAEHFGEENASTLNLGLERKMILKNQQKGMVTWAKQIAGLTPKAKRDIISRVNKMTDVLTPETEEAFLEDLAAQALGVSVSMEEAGNITALAQETTAKKEVMESSKRRGPNEGPTKIELDYGRAAVAFDNYLSTLKLASEGTLSDRAAAKIEDYKENPFRILKEGLKFIAESSREMRTTLDNSYIGKQGRNLFFKGMTGDFAAGKAWWDTFKRSHRVIWETMKGKGPQVMDELRAEIVSDPDYELMKKARVATSVVEEEAPAEWFSDLPYLGRPFAASHNAFTASAHLLRYRTARYYFDKARKLGTDLTDKEQLEGIGSLVNALTGRGEFGKRASDKPGLLNNVFFSPRLLKADFDILTSHVFDSNATSFVRKEALKNLMRIVIGQALILAVADLLDDDAVEWDPRSADFGKIRVGNTRFDVSSGVGVIVRLAARLAPLIINKEAKYKNSKGKLVKINQEGWGKRTGLDIAEDFLENKTAPLMSVFLAHLEGNYRYTDEKPTVLGDIRELYLPLSLDNIKELHNDEESANMLTAALADAYGVFTQTYDSQQKQPIEIQVRQD
jgi:hypothetical protein